jgi:hypothetical protein
VQKAAKITAHSSVHEDERTTDSEKLCRIARMLRNSGINPTLTSVALGSDDSHKPIVIEVKECMSFTQHWCNRASKQCRSVEDAEQWLVKQLSGEAMKHIIDTLCAPGDWEILKRCGVRRFESLAGSSEDFIALQDESAARFGELCREMAGCRLARITFLFGWPVRLNGLLGDESLQKQTMAAWNKDIANWRNFENSAGHNKETQDVIDRSNFKQPNVETFREATSFIVGSS